MGAGLVCAVIVLAACGEKPGVYVKISGSQSLDKVAVYIGKKPCTDQGGTPCAIAPMGLRRIQPLDPGGTWFRDANTPFVASASGGTARIHVEASGPNEIVQIVVLGLDATDTPIATGLVRDVPVPMNDVANLSVTINDAVEATDNEEGTLPHPDGDYWLRWADPQAPTDCVLVEHWEGGTAMQTFVVPSEDADCDGYAASDPKECDDFVFQYSSKTANGNPSCAMNESVPANGTHSCVLGGSGCIDGTGATGTCLPLGTTTTCVPDAICNSACAQPNNTSAFSACAGGIGGAVGLEVQCTIYAVADQGVSCPPTATFTSPTTGKLILDGLFVTSGMSCQDVSFAPVDSMYGLTGQLTGMKLFTPAPGSARLDVTTRGSTGACNFAMSWVDGIVNPNSSPERAVVDIRIDNGNHMLLPVKLEYSPCAYIQPTTTDGILCYIGQTSDHITNCAL
jgi:hypothetical protein